MRVLSFIGKGQNNGQGSATLDIGISSPKTISTRWTCDLIEQNVHSINATRTTLSSTLGFQNYNYVGIKDILDTTTVLTFTAACGVTKVDITYPLHIGFNTSTDLDYFITNFNPEYFQIGAEEQNDLTSAQYISQANSIISYLDIHYPSVKIILDTPLSHKSNSISINWGIDLIAGITPKPQETGKDYIQGSDQQVFGVNQADNLLQIINYVENVLPTNLSSFDTRFVNTGLVQKMAMVQFHIEDASSIQYVANTPVGNYGMGRIIKWVLDNTDKITYLSWMSWQNLFYNDDTVKPDYYSIKRIYPVFTNYTNTVPITFPFNDLTGTLCYTSHNYCMIVQNKSNSDYTFLSSEIVVNGNPVSTFTRNTGYATSLDGSIINEIVTENDLVIKSYSNSVITFTA